MPIQLHLNKPVLISRSTIHGWGVFASKPIQKSQYIMEYVGELIDPHTADMRGKVYDKVAGVSYLFDLNDDFVVDAARLGSKSRFLNHSSRNPNCIVKVVLVNGDHRIRISSKKDIDAGEELTFDYGYTEDIAPTWVKGNI
jgi:histone-lysine N-methyltransferase EZH2